ncbi:MAG: DUF4911 domain-containing protein [Desulfovibrionaceae bacterium]|nr:DUF4911 domain-containing protein [Desulfovibrionaceae bacterium]
MGKARRPKALPKPVCSDHLLVRINPQDAGLFRFFLEARDGLGWFCPLNRNSALMLLTFSPHQRKAMLNALEEISEEIALEILPWPAMRTGEKYDVGIESF